MALTICQHITQVLVECSTERHIQHLESTTYSQQGFVLSHNFANEGNLEIVMLINDAVNGVATTRVAVSLRGDVTAALDEHPIDGSNEPSDVLDRLGKGRYGHRDPACACNRSCIKKTVGIAVTSHTGGSRRELAGQENPWGHVRTSDR